MSETLLDVGIQLGLDSFELDVALQSSARAIGFFGPSGAGKTSLLESIAGLRRDARGHVRFRGECWLDTATKIRKRPELRRVGYVPQDAALFPHRDVRGNLRAGRHYGTSGALGIEEVSRLLELDGLLERDVRELSGGERQRVALGRALCSNPRLLLLDEPLASLDMGLRRRLLPYLLRVRDAVDVPMLIVTHDPVEAQALCEELFVLREGRIVTRGRPREVLTDPSVFPLAARAGFENVLRCHVHREGGRATLVLGQNEGASELVVIGQPERESGLELVGVPAHEIIIATARPVGLSARNVLSARVTAIQAGGAAALVFARLASDGTTISVEVTERTPREMGLEVGADVFLVIKASSCRLYGALKGARS